ncbi:MAG: DUF2207 domain-containing protein [Candidatus Ancillula sp.]|jgi:hypothetical protein|nr:DUF2207 domain-containing protein [Candidatus Ancillula sp.]
MKRLAMAQRIKFSLVVLTLFFVVFFSSFCNIQFAQAKSSSSSVSSFSFKSLTADYYLSTDNGKVGGKAQVKATEQTIAEFKDSGNTNHGITRVYATERKFNDKNGKNIGEVKYNLDITSMNGGSTTKVSNEETNDISTKVVQIGEKNNNVHGEKTYQIDWSANNVVLTKNVKTSGADSDEFFWQVNGDGADQEFDSVVAKVHVPSYLASKVILDQKCLQGVTSSTDKNCAISKSEPDKNGDIVYIFTSDGTVAKHRTMSIGIDFTPQTFEKTVITYNLNHFSWVYLLALIILVFALLCNPVIFPMIAFAINKARMVGQTIEPFWKIDDLAKDGVDLEKALTFLRVKDKITPILLKLAVDKKIEFIADMSKDGAFSGKQTANQIKIIDDQNVTSVESSVIAALREAELNGVINIKDLRRGNLAKNVGKKLKEVKSDLDNETENSVSITGKLQIASSILIALVSLVCGFLTNLATRGNDNSYIFFILVGFIAILILTIGLQILGAISAYIIYVGIFVLVAGGLLLLTAIFGNVGIMDFSRGATIGFALLMIIIALLIIFLSNIIMNKAARGVDKEYIYDSKGIDVWFKLQGLKEFLRVTEEDRLRVLQGPDTAKVFLLKEGSLDQKAVIQLYEKFLPWANLFGYSNKWNKVLKIKYLDAQNSGLFEKDALLYSSAYIYSSNRIYQTALWRSGTNLSNSAFSSARASRSGLSGFTFSGHSSGGGFSGGSSGGGGSSSGGGGGGYGGW